MNHSSPAKMAAMILAAAFFAATATGEVWCSDDGGDHWEEIMTGLAPISKGNHYASLVTA